MESIGKELGPFADPLIDSPEGNVIPGGPNSNLANMIREGAKGSPGLLPFTPNKCGGFSPNPQNKEMKK